MATQNQRIQIHLNTCTPLTRYTQKVGASLRKAREPRLHCAANGRAYKGKYIPKVTKEPQLHCNKAPLKVATDPGLSPCANSCWDSVHLYATHEQPFKKNGKRTVKLYMPSQINKKVDVNKKVAKTNLVALLLPEDIIIALPLQTSHGGLEASQFHPSIFFPPLFSFTFFSSCFYVHNRVQNSSLSQIRRLIHIIIKPHIMTSNASLSIGKETHSKAISLPNLRVFASNKQNKGSQGRKSPQTCNR